MTKRSETRPHVEKRHENRVSSAVWPLSVRKVVATGKAAQWRRDWIMQGRWWLLLANAMVMRALFALVMLLVVVASLLVAILGIAFWYLLLLPLFLFAGLLMLSSFLTSRSPAETAQATLGTFAQELKSSAGALSLFAQELKSQPGTLALRSGPGLLSGETPSTPMPGDPPLVRVLETYDLRTTSVEHFLSVLPEDVTGEHELVHADGPECPGRDALVQRELEDQLWGNSELTLEDFPKSEPGKQSDL